MSSCLMKWMRLFVRSRSRFSAGAGAVAWFAAGVAHGETFRVVSPDQHVVFAVHAENDTLATTLTWRDAAVLDRSPLTLLPGVPHRVRSAAQRDIDATWTPVWGEFSTVRDHCRELTLELTLGDLDALLLVRVYDQAVGYRFVLPAQAAAAGQALVFDAAFNPVGELAGYFPNGEREPLGPEPLSGWLAAAAWPAADAEGDSTPDPRALRRNLPAVFERPDGTYLAILESDLYSARALDAAYLRVSAGRPGVAVTANAVADGGELLTPWRVVLLGDTPGDLIESRVALNLAAPCQIADPSWIAPGKGLWDWRIHGYDNGDFVYGIDTRSYLRMIDFAAEHGIDYLTIDDHWFTRADTGVMDIAPEVDLPRVMAHAEAKGVRVILYYDRKKGAYGDEGLFDFYRGLGAAGIKYGFMGRDAAFTRDSMERAAATGMLIFYHDNPVPMTGARRTLPNLLTREYGHAQQDSRRALSPRSFLKTAMVNNLSGPMDQANGNFGIQSINAGERKKGPRKLNTYVSTVVSEVARTLVVHSGLITLPDAPEEYRKKADLFDFLVQMPVTWNETRVVNSKMATYITTARRAGDTWFVGSVNDETPRALEIALDFLTPGQTYDVTFFEDAPDAHGVDNPEAYRIRTEQIPAGATVTAAMAVGGGHAMILRPAP